MSDYDNSRHNIREATLEAIFKSITDSLMVLDKDLMVYEANDYLLNALGKSREEVIGRPWDMIFPHLVDTGKGENLRTSIREGVPHRSRIPIFDTSSGMARLYDVTTYPVFDSSTNEVTHLVEYTREVTEEVRAQLEIMDYNRTLLDIKEQLEQKSEEVDRANRLLAEKINDLEELNKRLERMAVIDVMTDLPNHRAFQDRLAYEIKKSFRHGRTFSLIILDVDHFKIYNDKYGHPAGDVLLTQLAKLMRMSVREVDLPARYGGEEFAIILPETDKYGGAVVAERMRSRVADYPFKHRQVTISIGVAEFPSDGEDAGALISAADKAMYYSKTHGRNSICLYRHNLDTNTVIPEPLPEDFENVFDDTSAVDKLTGLRVLFVEEDNLTMAMLYESLSDLGHKVLSTGNAQEAINALSHTANGFDIVIAGLALQEKSGFDFRIQVRHIDSNVPIIFLSSYADQDILRRVHEEDLCELVGKPFQLTSLDSLMSHLVTQSTRRKAYLNRAA